MAQEIIGAPALQRMLGLPSTPENSGQIIDRTGTTDATTALNAWFTSLVANGDEGYLGPGSFKTSAELVITGGSGKGIRLRGAGPQNTVIKPTANTFNGLRVNLTDALVPKGSISDLSIASAASLPAAGSPNNKAAFMCDATTLMKLDNLSASGFDVGYDFINNCYNTHGYSLHVPRFATCNVGINLREGSQSGSDMHFHSSYLFPALHAVCIKGNGGGFHFFGGQMSTTSTATGNTNRGVLQLGWDYVNQVNGGSLSACSFSGIGIEGFLKNWTVNSVQPLLGCEFLGFNLLANDNTANKALGIWQATNLGNSSVKWDNCSVGQSFFANAAVASLAGNSDGFALDEGPWCSVSGTTLNGSSQGDQWLTSLGYIAQGSAPGGSFTYGRGFYNETGKNPIMILGKGLMGFRGGAFQHCVSGTTWVTF